MTHLCYVIRARIAANVAVVSIQVSQGARAHAWRWEVPLVLWAAMGTAATALFAAQQYLEQYPEEHAHGGLVALASAIGAALASHVEP